MDHLRVSDLNFLADSHLSQDRLSDVENFMVRKSNVSEARSYVKPSRNGHESERRRHQELEQYGLAN
jgi:hypothetical protein